MELVGMLWQYVMRNLIAPIARLHWGNFFVTLLFAWPMMVGNVYLIGVLFPEKPGNYYAAVAVGITAMSAILWAGIAFTSLTQPRH